MKKVIFACVHNAGRSQMAAAFFNQLVNPNLGVAFSAGTEPADHVHPVVLETMSEIGIDLSKAKPTRLTQELCVDAYLLITMGCGEKCPYVPGLKREDWPLPDPKGKSPKEVRKIRDEIKEKVVKLIELERIN